MAAPVGSRHDDTCVRRRQTCINGNAYVSEQYITLKSANPCRTHACSSTHESIGSLSLSNRKHLANTIIYNEFTKRMNLYTWDIISRPFCENTLTLVLSTAMIEAGAQLYIELARTDNYAFMHGQSTLKIC